MYVVHSNCCISYSSAPFFLISCKSLLSLFLEISFFILCILLLSLCVLSTLLSHPNSSSILPLVYHLLFYRLRCPNTLNFLPILYTVTWFLLFLYKYIFDRFNQVLWKAHTDESIQFASFVCNILSYICMTLN